jgi:hypothetical protein
MNKNTETPEVIDDRDTERETPAPALLLAIFHLAGLR